MNGQALGVQPASRVMGYEARLFDTARVHAIDIVMDDWDSFLGTCENEEYASCAVVIDSAYTLIAPYVERDPTKFCTAGQFETGVEALKTFCTLRAESLSGQLAAAIPAGAPPAAARRRPEPPWSCWPPPPWSC